MFGATIENIGLNVNQTIQLSDKLTKICQIKNGPMALKNLMDLSNSKITFKASYLTKGFAGLSKRNQSLAKVLVNNGILQQIENTEAHGLSTHKYLYKLQNDDILLQMV